MENFPVDEAIPELKQALNGPGLAVLTAPPGSGKTTRVPLALLDSPWLGAQGKILVLEPRRLAARAAARYMSRRLGEEMGGSVGYRVRLDRKISARTRVEFLTEGMLTRLLVVDPELSGVGCVIFDEFHERSLQADLGLALCLEARAALRPDLRLLVMSATLDVTPLRALLGGCPLIQAAGHSWPVTVRHVDPREAVGGLPVNIADLRELAGKAALAAGRALREEEGDILVFLPGAAEIGAVAAELVRLTRSLPPELAGSVDIFTLYGDLPPERQDAALAPAAPGRRKVVLASAIAQTSLTIEGVRTVIDSGLARSACFDPASGMSRLVTFRASRDDAEQRAGRAGRLGPGLCLRLWPEGEILPEHARPEILEADLAPLLLDLLAWGSRPEDLAWLTPPPAAALREAGGTLLRLGAAEEGDSSGVSRLRITKHGQALAHLPLHPRLGHMVLSAGPEQAALAACLAALVAERDPLRGRAGTGLPEADIRLRLSLLGRPENRRLREAAAQIWRQAGYRGAFKLPPPDLEDFSGGLLSLAWPERIARRRAGASGAGVGFSLASGQGGFLPLEDPLAGSEWLAVSGLTAPTNKSGSADHLIRLAAPLTEAELYRLHGPRLRKALEVFWDEREDALVSREVTRLDALVVAERRPDAEAATELAARRGRALLERIVRLGLGCLPWTEELRQWQARVQLLRRLDLEAGASSDWPDLSDPALGAALEDALKNDSESWLTPWLGGISRRSQFNNIDLGAALRSLLPWPLPRRLDEEAPERLGLPSGSSAKIDYAGHEAGPVLAVKLQEMFGQSDTPCIAGGRCPLVLHLLSPAGRPLQVTRDLEHFWRNAYAQVRAEMRGRYPKHPWPEDPLAALPTRKTKAALARKA